MKRILYIPLILLTAATLISCSSDVSMGDKESETKKPPTSLPGDVDGDGVLDENDNCPTVANADQADSDGNGMGDICEGLAETCESNFCQDNDLLSGYHCNNDVSIRCGLDEDAPGCVKPIAESDCSFGCQEDGVNAGFCEGPPADPTQPEITSISGTPQNGGTFALSGNNLGSHTLDLSSAVGPNGWIETNDINTPLDELVGAPNWVITGEGGEGGDIADAFVDASHVYSGSHAINADVDKTLYSPGSHWQRPLGYHRPEGIGEIYATWWVYYKPVQMGSFIQWKHWYLSPIWHHSVCSILGTSQSIDPDFGFNYSLTSAGCCIDGCVRNYCVADVVSPYPDLPGGYSYPTSLRYHNHGGATPLSENAPGVGKWTRIELYAKASSVPDAPDGYFEYYTRKENETRHHVDTWENYITHSASCIPTGSNPDGNIPWRYFMLLGYQDDNGSSFANEVVDLSYDDIYLQFGTQARLELGNQPSYGDCTKIEVQTPTSWSENNIELELNFGRFQPGEKAFLFVVREDGKVSPGFEITLE